MFPCSRWTVPAKSGRKTTLIALGILAALNVVYWSVRYEPWGPNRTPWPPVDTEVTSLGHYRTSKGVTVSKTTPGFNWEPEKFWGPLEELSSGYGDIPFPIESASYLPDAYSVVSSCKQKINQLFFVHTAPAHTMHRDILRSFLGDPELTSMYNWTTVFFVGLSKNQRVMNAVVEEADRHGDIVVLPYLDSYRNLTYKYIYGMKWTMDNCPSAQYIVKMDDDIVIHLEKLVSYLENVPKPEKPAFHCCVWNGMPVIRHTNSPWYISKRKYPKKVFPRYCSGSVVMFRGAVLRALYNASFSVDFMSVDDAYVTGEVAKRAGVGHVPLNKYYSFSGDKWDVVAKGDIMFGHIQDETLRVKAWSIIVENLKAGTTTTSNVVTPATLRSDRWTVDDVSVSKQLSSNAIPDGSSITASVSIVNDHTVSVMATPKDNTVRTFSSSQSTSEFSTVSSELQPS